MNLKNGCFNWIKNAKCPCCGVGSFEFVNAHDSGIFVNCESKGRCNIENFWVPSRVCTNPLCKWSRIRHDIEPYNMIDVDKAWKLIEEKEVKDDRTQH